MNAELGPRQYAIGRAMGKQSDIACAILNCVKLRVVIVALLGLALAIYVVAYAGIGAVFSAVAAVGWGGFALLCLYVLALFIVLGSAWCVLLPESSLANLRGFIWARMVREAAADVLPFSQLGGIVLGARAAILHGISEPLVYASIIVDVTTEMLAQIAYVAMGVLILDLHAPPSSFAQSLITALLIGVVCAVAVAGVFLALQRRGHRVVEKFMARLLPRALRRTMAVNAALSSIYRSRARVGASMVASFCWVDRERHRRLDRLSTDRPTGRSQIRLGARSPGERDSKHGRFHPSCAWRTGGRLRGTVALVRYRGGIWTCRVGFEKGPRPGDWNTHTSDLAGHRGPPSTIASRGGLARRPSPALRGEGRAPHLNASLSID
jgi:hypothetical protein